MAISQTNTSALPPEGSHSLQSGHCVRIVVVDGHSLFRAGLVRFLEREADFNIVGDCGASLEALGIVASCSVDLILMDFDLGAEHGTQALSRLTEAGYRGRFLMMAGAAAAHECALALKLGASGIFLKSDAPERLIHAIRQVANGDVWIDSGVLAMLAHRVLDSAPEPSAQPSVGLLPDRERKVLLGVLSGYSNRRIGDDIGISESLVKAIVQRLFARTGVNTRSQLVRAALEGSFAQLPAMR